jgi:hypothetical protein
MHNATLRTERIKDMDYVLELPGVSVDSPEWIDALSAFVRDDELLYSELFYDLAEDYGEWKMREADATDVDLGAIAVKSPKVRQYMLDRVNDALVEITTNKYYEHVPLAKLIEAVESAGFVFDEEEMPFMLLGHEGQAIISAKLPGIKRDYALKVSWYRMPSGRFEVVSYFN